MQDDLQKLRQHIDQIDAKILELFAERFEVVKEVGEYKKANNLPIINKGREEEVIRVLTEKANELGVSPDFIRQVWQTIYQEAYKLEK